MSAELGLALERLGVLLRRMGAPREMSLTATSTLRSLESEGPHRLCDLARREGTSQPAMTQLVTRLERDGLVERLGDDADGRVVMVHLTGLGARRLEERRADRAARLEQLLATLPEDEREAVAAAVPALLHLADSRAGVPA